MKSLEELKKIREEEKKKMTLRDIKDGYQIVVSMGTTGIAHGARDVLHAIVDEVDKKDLRDVTVTISGCMKECPFEPLVKVIDTKGNEFMYGKVDTKNAKKIVDEHVMNHQVIKEMLLENYEG